LHGEASCGGTDPPLLHDGLAGAAVYALARPATGHDLPAPDPGNLALKAFTQVHSRIEEAQARHGSVQVQLIPRRATREAPVHVAPQVGGEGAAARRGGAMHRTRPPDLVPGSLAGDEADQVQDIGQGDQGADLGEANARHGGDLRGRAQGRPRCEAVCPPRPRNREEEPVVGC